MNRILQQLINFLFERRLKKYLRISQREKRFVNYKSARSIILLFESDYNEKNPEIRQLIQSYAADGKKVMAWGYVDKKEVASAILPDFRILHHKDADFTQFPEQMFLQELESLTFDLLIDLTVNEIKPLQYIAMYANAACKVGTHNTTGIYDMLVDVSQLKADNVASEIETTSFQIYNHLIFYLKSIQTND